MRKIFLAILFLAICGSAYSEMVIVVEETDSSVSVIHPVGQKSLEAILNENEKSGLNYLVMDAKDLPATDSDAWVLKNKKIQVDAIKKEKIEKERTLKEVNIQQIKSDLFDAFSTELMSWGLIGQVYPIISDLLEYKRFDKLKTYVGELQTNGVVDAQFVTKINQVLLNNGIDLTKIESYKRK